MSDPTYKALLIGNSTFPNDTHNLQSLEGPVNDISVLRDALTDPEVGLFEPTAVRMLPERTMAEILIELETFFASATRDDRLLLYYSGHGLLTDENRLLLCARDTRTDVVKATSVSATAINDMIDGSAAQTTMIVLDCCYSGAFKGANLPDSLKGNGRYLVTSCRSGQLANDATRRNGTSQFTQHLVDGLLNAVPDTNGDGYVELNEIYDYVHSRLQSEGRQIPQRNFSGGGSVAVARRPQAVATEATASVSEFELSQTTIDLDDIEPGETLPPEQVYVLAGPGQTCDFSVDTSSDWLEVEAHDGYFSVVLRPVPGTNRANVVVRDRATGATRTLRVRVRVREEEPVPPGPAAGGGVPPATPPVAVPRPVEGDAAPEPGRTGALRGRLQDLRRRRPVPFWLGLTAAAVLVFMVVGAIVSAITEEDVDSGPSVGSGPAGLDAPESIAVDAAGSVYVADTSHARVRRISPDGQITTVAGYGGDDPQPTEGASDRATSTYIGAPSAVAIDANGNLVFGSSEQPGIFAVSPDGRLSTVPIHAPGAAPMVSAIAVGPDGGLVVAVDQQVFRLGTDGTPTLVAGAGPSGYTGDGGPAIAARLNNPRGLAVDRQGAVYISDTGNHRVRKVGPDGTIVTIAGTGTEAITGDGGPAVAADVISPYGLALDGEGNLLVATSNQVRKVASDGTISRVAGSPDDEWGYSGDNGPALAALLGDVVGVARDPAGNLYVTERGTGRVRRIAPDGIITTVG